MPENLKTPCIKLLPPQLANQIAAGEVIERPASVVKELLENALDAGARRIDVELQSGGMEGIRITDDGSGILADELQLAVSRHATSKISELDDLLHLGSLGFRGEALASICSVSQWTITSCAGNSDSAHSISYKDESRVVPANHRQGTTMLVSKLFYNTPARRKFLRAERTEFRHCDDVIRRIALARFDVGFYVRHNGRYVHRLPAVDDDIGQTRRVAQICGDSFINNAIVIDFPGHDMRLWGWISKPEFSRQQTDLQYFYINGRVIRDRVVNHAIRLAYQNVLPAGRHAAYVLHLEVDPASVDVNVHPTKHEVRFRETRLVHDFITRSVREGLNSKVSLPVPGSKLQSFVRDENQAYTGVTEQQAIYAPAEYQQKEQLVVLHHRFLVHKQDEQVFLIDIVKAHARLVVEKWQQHYQNSKVVSKPLLIPQAITVNDQQLQNYEKNLDCLNQLGFDMTQSGPAEIMLRSVPVCLQAYALQDLLPVMLTIKSVKELFEDYEKLFSQKVLRVEAVDLSRLIEQVMINPADYSTCMRELGPDELSSLFDGK